MKNVVETEFEYFTIGMAVGLNIAISENFNKVWEVMNAESISNHDGILAVSEDIALIEMLLKKQQEVLSSLAPSEGEHHERTDGKTEETT